jgi:hypothetical protein
VSNEPSLTTTENPGLAIPAFQVSRPSFIGGTLSLSLREIIYDAPSMDRPTDR